MVSRLVLLLSLLFAPAVVIAADRPTFHGTARVKQHFHKTGDLIKGEEELRKLILKWDGIPNAQAYELCHNCNNIDEATGREVGEIDGTIYPIEIGGRFVCGGQPCNVM